jgi:hypothetical protein
MRRPDGLRAGPWTIFKPEREDRQHSPTTAGHPDRHRLDTSSGFDPLAWQILFMLGVYLGRRMLPFGRTLPPSHALTAAAVVGLVAGLLLRLSWFGALPFILGIPESVWIIGKDGRGTAGVTFDQMDARRKRMTGIPAAAKAADPRIAKRVVLLGFALRGHRIRQLEIHGSGPGMTLRGGASLAVQLGAAQGHFGISWI